MLSCRESTVVLGDLRELFNHLEGRVEWCPSVWEDSTPGAEDSWTHLVGVPLSRLSETKENCDDSRINCLNEGIAVIGEVMAISGDSWLNFVSESGVEWAGLDWIGLTGEDTGLGLGEGESGGFGLCLGMRINAGEWHWEGLANGTPGGEGLTMEIWSSKFEKVWFNLVFGSEGGDVGSSSKGLSCCAVENIVCGLSFGESLIFTFWPPLREMDRNSSEVVERCCDLWSLIWSGEQLSDLCNDVINFSVSCDDCHISWEEFILISELPSQNNPLVIVEKDGVEVKTEQSPPPDKSSFSTAANLLEEKQTYSI